MKLTRMWINQPSTKQDFHDLHGKKVLVHCLESMFTQVWFLEGDTISMIISRNVLSYGWNE